MATADTQDRTPAPLLPPDEKFWKRYSPHYELPLAGAASLLAHGLILGVLALGGLAFLFRGSLEASKPPSMDVVAVEGGAGDGQPVGGGIVGDPDGGGPEKTEITAQEPVASNVAQAAPNTLTPAPPLMADDSVPMLDETIPDNTAADLAKIVEAANVQANKQPTRPAPEAKATSTNVAATPGKKPGPLGTRGAGKFGTGTGLGKGDGPGRGSGMGGGPMTQQEKFARRWRFDLSGDGKQHADKLAKVGFNIAFPDPRGGFLVVRDLSRRPAELRKDNLAALKDAVRLENRVPKSIQELTQELRLPFTPPLIILMIPKDREEMMAAEEARFARENNRDFRAINETWFDFRKNRDGEYEPVAIRQQ